MAENFPPDLVDLQRGFQDAHQRILDFLAERQGAAWTAEDDEELARLRVERETARKSLWAHPEHAGILADGKWPALKKAAEAPGWENAKG